MKFVKPFSCAVVALTLLTASACSSSVPMATGPEDSEGKQFRTPSPEQAAVYLFRGPAGLGGGEVVFTPSIGQRILGGLAPRTWLRVDLPAGRHDLRCIGGENQGSLVLMLSPGEIRFIEIEAGSGWVNYRCHFVEVSGAKGRADVLSGNRAQDIR